MAQIVRDTSLGERLGTGLGSGVGEGIGGLLDYKLQQMRQQNQQRQLAQAYRAAGKPEYLAYLPQEIAKYLLESQSGESYKEALGQVFGGEGVSGEGGFQNVLGQQGQQPGMSQQQGPPPVGALQALQTMHPQYQAFKQPEFPGQQQAAPALSPQYQGAKKPAPALSPQQQASKSAAEEVIKSNSSPTKKIDFSKLTVEQAEKLAAHLEKKQEREALELEKKWKFSKDRVDEILNREQAANRQLFNLNRMEELNNSGKLDTAGYEEFLKEAGFDIAALRNPESEEFKTIAKEFLRDAKTFFGARVTQNEVNLLLSLIPSLSQSPEGRKRVIANLKYFANADKEQTAALKQVLKENRGVPPYELGIAIDDKVGKKLDSLAKKFKEDLAKPVPASRPGIETAAGALLGKVIGAPGKLLGGLGSIGQGLGAIANIGEVGPLV